MVVQKETIAPYRVGGCRAKGRAAAAVLALGEYRLLLILFS
jgi:hypothetical protein